MMTKPSMLDNLTDPNALSHADLVRMIEAHNKFLLRLARGEIPTNKQELEAIEQQFADIQNAELARRVQQHKSANTGE